MSLWTRFWADDSGQDLAEYALLIALIALVVIGAVTGLVSAGIAYLYVGNPVMGIALFAAMVVTMAVAVSDHSR